MVHIAICDDEKVQTDYLKLLVKDWAAKSKIVVQVDLFSSAESFLFESEENQVFDIIILDIEMGEMNGVELAKKVREKDKLVQIIFITGYMEYISAGYDVEALNYLLKPVDEKKFVEVMNRASERLKMEEKKLVLHTKESTVKISQRQIRYVEVNRNYLTIHAEDKYNLKMTLGEMEKKLDERFVRVSRSFLVNMQSIQKITKDTVYLKGNEQIPLSKKMYNTVNQKFIQPQL